MPTLAHLQRFEFFQVPGVQVFPAKELLLHDERVRRASRLREGSELPNRRQKYSPRAAQPSRLHANGSE